MSVRIITLVDNVHMGLGHIGLAEVAKKFAKVKIEELGAGEILMFLNRRKDKLKIFGHKGLVIGYLKMPKGQRIMLDAIQYLPQTFGSTGSISYDTALKKALETRLQRGVGSVLSPLQVVRAMDRSGLTARKQQVVQP